MKKLLMLLTAVTISLNSYSQGIIFEERGSTLEQAIAKAKKENKLVFVDCYSRLCGPCIWVQRTLFTTREAGEFFNPRFVNFKIDVVHDEGGPEIARKYGVTVHPTFLVLNGDGEVLRKQIGFERTIRSFIAQFRPITDPDILDRSRENYLQNKNLENGLEYMSHLIIAGRTDEAHDIIREIYFLRPQYKFNEELLRTAMEKLPVSDPVIDDILLNRPAGEWHLGADRLNDLIRNIYVAQLDRVLKGWQKMPKQDIEKIAQILATVSNPRWPHLGFIGKIAMMINDDDYGAAADYFFTISRSRGLDRETYFMARDIFRNQKVRELPEEQKDKIRRFLTEQIGVFRSYADTYENLLNTLQ
jgi:thioredoxin-related protein